MTMWLIPTALAVGLQLWLNVYAIARPPLRPIRAALHAMLLAALLFSVGDLLASHVVTSSTARWGGLVLLYSGVIFIGPTWWLLALRYCEAQQLSLGFGRKKWVYIPLVLATAIWIGLITNPWHHQFVTPQPTGASAYHWLWWWNAGQSYALLVGVSILYAVLIYRESAGARRNQLVILFLATVATTTASTIYVFAPFEMPFDPTSIGVCVASILFIYGIHGTRLFSLSPVALTEVMQHQPGGILVISSSGHLLYANETASHLLGSSLLPLETPAFQCLADTLSPTDDPDARIDAQQLQDQLTRVDQPERGHLFRFGEERQGWLRVDAAPVPGRRGTVRGWSLSLADQTAFKKAADAIQAGELAVLRARNLESLGVMAGGIAHDFNNLLQGILGNAELALEQTSRGSVLSEHLGDIEKAAMRASKLVAQLLLFSGGATTQKRNIDFAKVLPGIANFVSPSIPNRINLQISPIPKLPLVDADSDQIGQAIVNLIVNASEAIGDEKGTVQLTASTEDVFSKNQNSLKLIETIPPGRYLRIEVSDDGGGMPAEVRARIFEPFYSTKFPGRGLGLSALLGIARGHAGGLAIQTDVGVGTRVSLYLPVREAICEQPVFSPPPIDPDATIRVLVVDDEPPVRSVCARALRRAGVEVAEAGTGAAAIECTATRDFDVAIVDLTMPGIDGLETARQLRNLDPQLRIILSSGHNDGNVQHGVDTDLICAFLHKPYRSSDLLSLLNRLLNTSLEPHRFPA